MNRQLVLVIFGCLFQSVFLIDSRNQLGSINGRILGGKDVEWEDISFFCSVFFPERPGRKHHCGCAVVNSRWAITSAKCVYDKVSADVMIMAIDGEHRVNQIVVHDEYEEGAFANDISLIRSPEAFTDEVQPIRYVLPEQEELEEGMELQLYGFGRLNECDIYPTQIQMLAVKAISLARCRMVYGQNSLDESNFCTLPKLSEGLCFGDTGTPLVLNLNSTNYLIGIANAAIPCGIGFPDVFADVTQFEMFIEKTSNESIMNKIK